MFEYLSAEQLAREAKTADAHIVVIDGNLVGERALIDAISGGIESPYENDPRDGLSEALRDFHARPVREEVAIGGCYKRDN